jgi:glycosyltransferase involved in cell wall biosynthesis
VGIGLAVHQGEAFLEVAVESLLAQELSTFELVISDNGSTDRTEEICRDLAARDPRIRYHRNPVNRGAAWNYNNVFRLSQGEYFKWAAHDDVCRPSFLSRCVRLLDERPDVGLCYTTVIDIDEHGEFLKEYPPHPYADEDAAPDRIASVLRYPSHCFETFGVMRRSLLARTRLIGPYTSSDRTLLLEMAVLGKFHEIPEPLLLHRQHPGRSMQRYRDARERNAWFDTTKTGRWSAPRWRLLGEQARAIGSAPLGLADRIRAFGHLARLGVHSTGLLRDLAGLAKRTVGPGSRTGVPGVER